MTFVHMQIMLTSDQGDVLNPDDVEDDAEEGPGVQEGAMIRADQITYLYRLVNIIEQCATFSSRSGLQTVSVSTRSLPRVPYYLASRVKSCRGHVMSRRMRTCRRAESSSDL